MSLKSRHRHRYTKFIIDPPKKLRAGDDYRFMLRCDCGYSKLIDLPRTVDEVFLVIPPPNERDVQRLGYWCPPIRIMERPKDSEGEKDILDTDKRGIMYWFVPSVILGILFWLWLVSLIVQ